MNYAIIGAGAAGIEAALAVRKNDADGTITVFTRENTGYYYRPKLVEFIGEDMPADKLVIMKPELFIEKKISIKTACEIVSIHKESKEMTDRSGNKYSYDRLLIASGSNPVIPPVKGKLLPGVFTLRTMDDAVRIRDYCRDVRDIVISGGGLLGLESAFSLAKGTQRVTVIEIFEFLLCRQLDRRGSRFLQSILEKKGLNFILKDSIDEIIGDERLQSIRLKSGKVIDAGCLIISAGVRADIALAESCGLQCDRGIVVDEFLRSSDENIYAAGDCASYHGKLSGLWTIAREQGKIAGMNMSGKISPYTEMVPSAMLKVSGIDLYSAGDFDSAAYRHEIIEDANRFIKLVYEGSAVHGVIVIGDPAAVKEAQGLINGRISMDEFRKSAVKKAF